MHLQITLTTMSKLDNLLTTFTITTGSLSLIGSSLLICTILRSKKKLSVPYRRLIFGTSFYDVFQSLGLTTSIFLSPRGTATWARGNTTTCDIQGFFTTIGAIGVPIYLCSLCIYYFCIIRLNMRKATFRKIEPYLHAVPISYSFFCGIFAFANQYFNNAGSVCYVAPKPITCEIFPDQECARGEGASRFRLLFLTYPSMVILVIVCIIMGIITLYAKKMEKLRSRYSFSRTFAQDELPARNTFESLWFKIRDMFLCLRSPSQKRGSRENVSGGTTDDLSLSTHSVTNRRRKSQNTNDRMSEINKQALLYVGSYILSYGFVWGQSLYSLASKKPPLLWLRLLSSIFFPLQGFINIFIYCRPHIVSLRTYFPDKYTWFQAFVVVLKSGGDDPLSAQQRRPTPVNRLQQSTQNRNSQSCRSLSEMDSDSSCGASVALSSEKKSSTILPMDIENQSHSANNVDLNSADDIPEALEEMVHNAEKTLETSIEEFRKLAEEDKNPKNEPEDDIEGTISGSFTDSPANAENVPIGDESGVNKAT